MGGALDRWWELALALRAWEFDVKPVGSDADLGAVASRVDHDDGVMLVDLLDSVERGVAAIAVCRSASATVPIAAVVSDPSLDLAQRLRALGVFCLAVQPLAAAKIRDVLEEAIRQREQLRLSGPSPKKVLIIDDDRDVRASIQALLESEGYAVCCAATGAEGLATAISEKPDLIVLDIMMENMWAGYEVNQTLKFQSGYEGVRKVPIVMVSSIEEPPAERFARSSDPALVTPDVYLTKPLDLAKFLETVRSLLAPPPSSGGRE
ncbi:MAG: response regulator [Deltaproteobacteria bacterium]|nr:response regulator [Deltaproteobacteria bacterium]